MIDWTHAGPSLVASFLASLVEFVEALTVVLAVGVVRGWRPALLGTGFGLAVLFFLVIVLVRKAVAPRDRRIIALLCVCRASRRRSNARYDIHAPRPRHVPSF